MQINTWFGGVGVGWMNYFTFIIIAVFISGLMVGRTPEFLCHKVEAREMKVASIVALLHPFVILVVRRWQPTCMYMLQLSWRMKEDG